MKKFFLLSIILFLPIKIDASKSFIDGVVYLSKYLSSKEYIELRKRIGDVGITDSLFVKAKKFYDGDNSEALLALTFSLLPFNNMAVKLPYIGITLNFPLPNAGDSLYYTKLRHQPRYLLFDSPMNNSGDIDKLAHYFANAFLSYNIGFFNLSKFMGIFVEYFEAVFKVQGSIDKKDLIVNHLGEWYGKNLKKNDKLLPSSGFSIYQLLYMKIKL
ncbi:hypothetical protein APF79_01730 [bacterium BRH_c32]|nr:MAG: hypothetical protein APF79_01730 [bacterium BRH_c32]